MRQRRKPVDAVLNASPIVPGRCLRHPLPLAQHEIRDDILLAASLFVAPYAYTSTHAPLVDGGAIAATARSLVIDILRLGSYPSIDSRAAQVHGGSQETSAEPMWGSQLWRNLCG